MTESAIPARRRKLVSILLGVGTLLLFLLLAGLNAFNVRLLNPSTTGRILVFTGLSVIAFLLFVTVLLLLVRNVLKLYADERSRVLGSRLRTRMLAGAVLVSLVPIGSMFAFSYGLMNRAVDRWFSEPANEVRNSSNRMALDLAQYSTANARVEAEAIAANLFVPAAPLPGANAVRGSGATSADLRAQADATSARSAHRSSSAGESRARKVTHALRPEARPPALAATELRRPIHSLRPANLDRETLLRAFREHEITLQNGFAIAFREGRPLAAFHLPSGGANTVRLKLWLPSASAEAEDDPALLSSNGDRATTSGADSLSASAQTSVPSSILAAADRSDQPMFSLDGIDYALGTAALPTGGTVVVGLPLPPGIAANMARLRSATDTYRVLYSSRRQVRWLYTLLLLLMTSLALFASSWLALHLSKQVTRPVEDIADAMEAVAAGDYAHRVEASATDELGELVRSFNRMATDLEGSRRAVLQTATELSAANATLEARRRELETMLETIPNGVATLSPECSIVLSNRALSEMMDPGGQKPFLHRTVAEVFPAEVVEVLERLIRRSHRMGSASSEIEISRPTNGHLPGETLHLLATVALLETPGRPATAAPLPDRSEREHSGYVLVLENATELLRAQKQSAWKEVARRVAHEIKNPLTPIALSAEQTRRHIDRLAANLDARGIEMPSVGVIRRCSEVISSSVESMRSLVDQFSALAEFPTAKPRPADLNTIVENALALFAGRMADIRVRRDMDPHLPLVLADPEALKRALGNLIDNAAEAMSTSLLRELQISTSLLPSGLVEMVVADSGTGLTDSMRERLFLPYFSTKERGTGLGLSIAAKIIGEHGGTIRAERNLPAGARFIVELRPAPATEVDLAPAAVESVNSA